MNYYKLVLERNGILGSMDVTNPYKLIYQPNVWITPEFPMFIFDDLERAIKERLGDWEVQIWRVDVVNPRPQDKIVHPIYLTGSQIRSFWKGEENPELLTRPADYGTLVADSVRLVERIM